MDTLKAPLTMEQIVDMTKEDSYLRAIPVTVDFYELIDGDLESFLDKLSEAVTGSEGGLTEISYRPVGVTDDGRIVVAVTGDVSDFLKDGF